MALTAEIGATGYVGTGGYTNGYGSSGGMSPSGGNYPVAGTQIIMDGKIYEYGSTGGIMPRLVGDAPPPPWEITPTPESPPGDIINVPPYDWTSPSPTPTPEPEPWPRYEFPEITMPTYQYPTYSPPPVPQTLTQPTIGQTAPAPQLGAAPPQHDWMAEAEKLAQTAEIQDMIRQMEQGLIPIRSTLEQLLAISPEDIEKRYQAEIAAPAQRYYEEQTLPSLRRSFVGPGTFWSSMRAGAEQRSGARLGEALMGERSRMYGQARGEALGAAGQAMQLEQQAFAGRAYPYETALKAAPMGVQQRAQDLQHELSQAQITLQGRAQDLESQLAQMQMEQQRYMQEAQLGYMSEAQAAQLSQQSAMHQSSIELQLEQLRQRERELWGYLNPLENNL